MNEHLRQLPIPPSAARDVKAVELARVWAAHGKQYVSLTSGLWDDPASWGIMLVDLAKHIANAYEQVNGKDRHDVLRRLKEGFDAEWSSETDEPSGGLVA
ncbi:MAG TPA: DUF5076 domain-containing protein [Planctomycetaceae bacterium]|nr:DUF5076 domain-containing protein [Planctomycetaceae bacterium]